MIQTVDKLRNSDYDDRVETVHYAKAMPGILKRYNLFESTRVSTIEPNATKRLLSDLNRLTRCLEIYLRLCVEMIKPSERLYALSEIRHVDAVLSFNYTDTFEKIYEPSLDTKPKYCYIHGKARFKDERANNMVLGIDEYLDELNRDTKVEYIRFKKYYQKIFKYTDYNYTEWFKRQEEKRLFIIGHSLDTTDKDVLREIITADNVETIIYYHSIDANARQIENLVKVLGYDKLNELARGRGGTSSIKFRQQL